MGAGHEHGGTPWLHADPAVERWANMRENTHQYFRFNRRTTRLAMVWLVAVPVALYYSAVYWENRWDFFGKKDGDSIYNRRITQSTQRKDKEDVQEA